MPTRVLTFVRSLLRLSLALALMLALPMLEWRGWDGQWRHGAAAWADDGDGGDGGDGGGGADGEGGFTFPWREPSRPAARPTRPPPRRTQRAPKPPPPPADVVPNELLALNPTPAALGRATALGATEVETVAAGALGLRVVRLRLPAGLSVQNALAQLVTTDPGVFERHHRYTLQQAKAATPAADRCEGPACTMPGRLAGLIDWPADARQCGRGQVVGMVDTPVQASHPALAGAELRAEGFHDADRTAAPADHGTAVAALLVGRADDAFAGLLPRARLFAAAPFHQPAQGEPIADASALVKSLDWLAAQRVQVIGMSLAGPRNLVLNAGCGRWRTRASWWPRPPATAGRTRRRPIRRRSSACWASPPSTPSARSTAVPSVAPTSTSRCPAWRCGRPGWTARAGGAAAPSTPCPSWWPSCRSRWRSAASAATNCCRAAPAPCWTWGRQGTTRSSAGGNRGSKASASLLLI